MFDPRTRSVELQFAVREQALIVEARRAYAQRELAAAAAMAIAQTEAAQNTVAMQPLLTTEFKR